MGGCAPDLSAQVSAAFDAMPDAVRPQLLELRALVYRVASETSGVGPLTETLKWGQPSYLTQASKSGTTLRLAAPKAGGFGVFVHCQTSVVSSFRQSYQAQDLRFDGARGLLFEEGVEVPEAPVAAFMRLALTYRLAA